MDQKIIIVGAGIGGLTAALALLSRGFDVSVYEQAEELGVVGAGIQISPNGTRVLASLGLLDELLAVSNEPQAKKIRLWNSGESWPLFDLGPECIARYGFPYLMVHRGDLHSLLVRAVTRMRTDAIHLGARLLSFDQTADDISVRFADGREVRGSLLIGADGVHSRVRASLFGETTAVYTGCTAWRGVIPAERLPDHLHSTSGINWVGPGRHVVTYPLQRGRLMNFVGVVERADWDGKESWTLRGTRDECMADFAEWHGDVLSLIENIDVHYRWALLSRPTIDTWHKGRAVLLGDACHAMLPFMAQGAVMAIEDGIVLARCLDAYRDDHEGAFVSYEGARVGRANRCVRAAEKNRQLFHNQRLAESADATRYVETEWNPSKVNERYDWLFSFDSVNGTLNPAQKAAARDPSGR